MTREKVDLLSNYQEQFDALLSESAFGLDKQSSVCSRKTNCERTPRYNTDNTRA